MTKYIELNDSRTFPVSKLVSLGPALFVEESDLFAAPRKAKDHRWGAAIATRQEYIERIIGRDSGQVATQIEVRRGIGVLQLAVDALFGRLGQPPLAEQLEGLEELGVGHGEPLPDRQRGNRIVDVLRADRHKLVEVIRPSRP